MNLIIGFYRIRMKILRTHVNKNIIGLQGKTPRFHRTTDIRLFMSGGVWRRKAQKRRYGFIGCGNMANAIMHGIIANGLVEADQIIGSDPTEAGRQRTLQENGIHVTSDNLEVVRQAETVFFTIKPQYYQEMISEIKDEIREDQLIISIAAGRTLDYIEEQFAPKQVKVVRLMPNTPAMVGEGMTAACPNKNVSEAELTYAVKICDGFGKTEVVSEKLFDVVTAVSGSSPAYIFMLIEAMADAAVHAQAAGL